MRVWRLTYTETARLVLYRSTGRAAFRDLLGRLSHKIMHFPATILVYTSMLT